MFSLCEIFCSAAVPTYRFRSTEYNSHSIQYVAVSQRNMNDIPSTKIPLRFANELQTDDYKTSGRITERVVTWCSSVIIEEQYMCLRHAYANICH